MTPQEQEAVKKSEQSIDKLTEVLNDICVEFDEAIEIQKKKLNGNGSVIQDDRKN